MKIWRRASGTHTSLRQTDVLGGCRSRGCYWRIRDVPVHRCAQLYRTRDEIYLEFSKTLDEKLKAFVQYFYGQRSLMPRT